MNLKHIAFSILSASLCLSSAIAQPALANTDDIAAEAALRVAGDATKLSSSVGLLERFDRYPAGTVFKHGVTTNGGVTSPEIGNIWRFSECNKAVTVNATTDVFTTSAAHSYTDGVPVTFNSSGTLPTLATTGLPMVGIGSVGSGGVGATTYYVRDSTSTTFKIAATLGGAALDITTTGSGTHVVGAGPIITADGGMRFYPGELGYLGTDVGEPIKSISIELKWDGTGGANSRNGLTMAFSNNDILSTNGNGISTTMINHSQTNYAYISAQGNYSEGGYGEPIGETVGSGLPWVASPAGGGVAVGEKYILTYEFEGDEMRIIAFGRIHRWKNPLIATTGYRHWWVEAEGFTLARGEVPTFYRIWINAPKYDLAPGWGSAQNSAILQKITSQGPVDLPQQFKFAAGTSFHAGALPSGYGVATPGTIYTQKQFQAAPYGSTGGQYNATLNGGFLLSDVTSSSTAGTDVDLANVMPGYQGLSAGGFYKMEILGNFPNSNAKTIKLRKTAFGTNLFNSGPINDTGPFVLTIYKMYRDANKHRIFTKLQTSTTTRMNFLETTFTDTTTISAATTVAGDVVIYDTPSVISLVPY